MSIVKNVFVNQIGYVVNQTKYAYVKDCKGQQDFYIKDLSGNLVYSGKLNSPKNDELVKEDIFAADFTSFNQIGDYELFVGEDKSYKFKIGEKIYKDTYYSLLNYFYLSRCGEDIKNPTGDSSWDHCACHTGIAKIYGTNLSKKVLGGWHDAGDYGRYVVAGAKTVMDLLLAYEMSKDVFNEFDILDEVKFELEWMLQMQREDGAVYHKISCYHFCGFIMPDAEKDEIVLAPISTAATADFAGCAAYAVNFYKDKDKDFAERLYKAAVKAQDYLDTHEDEFYKNPAEITTGGYGDGVLFDERYFALCSLYQLTGKEEYLEKAKKIRSYALSLPVSEEEPWKRNWMDAFSWGCVSAYGSEIIIKNKDKVADKEFVKEIEDSILARATTLLKKSNESSFGVSLAKVFWGSNGAVCDEAHILLLAYDITQNKDFFEAAKKQLDYVLGCNPLNLCYITGEGSNATVNPHHRPSGFVKKTMPGMLAGGPCAGLHDAVAKEMLQGKAPLSCYIDDIQSYSTNEIAIYWNSPLIFVVAKLGLL